MDPWQEKLVDAGYPEIVVIIDFETYFDGDYALGKMSTIEYISDNRFELLSVGYTIFGNEDIEEAPSYIAKPELELFFKSLKDAFGPNLEDCVVVAKNNKFDIVILAEKFGIYPKFTIDIDDLLRYYDARMPHKMKNVCKTFNLQLKGDTTRFRGMHYDDLVRTNFSIEHRDYTVNDVEIEKILFEQLLPLIANPRIELKLAQHTLELFTKPTLMFDFDLADKLIEFMDLELSKSIESIKSIIETFYKKCSAEETIKILGSDIEFVKLLTLLGAEIPVKSGKPTKNMIPFTGKGNIPALAKTDEGTRLLLDHNNPDIVKLIEARLAASSWPNHIIRLNNLINQAKASNGLCRVPLKYYGAHTGRWSGEERVNLSNLGGKGRGKAINELISKIRHTLKAPNGHILLLADSAQIEARNLAWYARQQDLIDAFASGRDIYSEYGTELFKTRVWRPTDEEEQTYEGKVASIRRGFSKDCILGYGYGEGANTAMAKCKENDMLRPMFDSGEYNLEFIIKSIQLYRQKFKQIIKFWKDVERAWKIVTMYPTEVREVGPLTFSNHSKITYIRLPSGRYLRYRYPKVIQRGGYYDGSYLWGKVYGGLLTENIVQSTCRDLLALWILAIEESGYHVVHHVYDETITMVKDGEIERAKQVVYDIMSNGPDWIQGMPLGVDIKISKHFKK